MFLGIRHVLACTLCGTVSFGAAKGQVRPDNSAGPADASHPQTKVAGGGKKEKPKAKEKPEADVAKALLKEQAVQLLRNAINSSRSVESPRQKAALVSEASLLLWGYDEQFARASLSDALDGFIQEYKEADVKSPNEKALVRGRLDAAIEVLLKALARKDPAMSESAMRRYQDVRAESQKNTPSDPSYKERLALAQESLDSDLKRSVGLASALLEIGVPSDFAQYLYDLRKRDAEAATALYRKALVVLSKGQAYGAADAINLSVYAFGERMVLVPVPDTQAEGKRLTFGISTRRLSSVDTQADASLPSEYMAAARSYLSAQFQPQSPRGSSAIYLGQSLFLVKKLAVYASRLGIGGEGDWQQIEGITETRCRNLGMDEEVIRYLEGFGERLAAQDDVFQMREATSLKEAKQIGDESQRDKLLTRGAWNMIQEQKFRDAEAWVNEVADDSTRRRLTEILHYYAGKRASEALDWYEFDRQAGMIEDLRIRSLLLIAGARARSDRGPDERNQAELYLLQARNLSTRITEKKSEAATLVAIASFSASLDPQLSRESLSEAVKLINSAEDYDGAELQVDVTLAPDFRVRLTLPDSDLVTCFRHSAELDWLNTLSRTEDLSSKRLKAVAQVAVSRAVL